MSRGIPNLDDASNDELESIYGVLQKLTLYITAKKAARECRENGVHQGALDIEKRLDEIYSTLPAWATWEKW
jgi:hypothetical protein